MRQALILLLALTVFVFPAHAQEREDASFYQVMDVAVDVTAANAASARDQAIMQAQRTAFAQLLARLGADSSLAARQDDDSLASLVQAFEVQKEQTSSVRYIGTFTVQFKPNAVRALLGKSGGSFSEARSKPVLVLPVVVSGGRAVLWEEATPWRRAWEESSRNAGLVPVIVPAGDLDDIALLSTSEAVNGNNQPALQALINKYQAGSAVVAVWTAESDPARESRVESQRYDTSGKAGGQDQFSLPAAPDAKALSNALNDGVKQVRDGLEKNWKQAGRQPKGPAVHLPVTVPIASLAEWNALKTRLSAVPAISRVNVITMARDSVSIELIFQGDIAQLQAALADAGISLDQTAIAGWVMSDGVAGYPN